MAFNEDNLTNLILTTLEEMENDIKKPIATNLIRKTDESQVNQLRPMQEAKNSQEIRQTPQAKEERKKLIPIVQTNISGKTITKKTQIQFLTEIREKMLVLFTGLQSKNLVNSEDKMDLVLNYLEYTLASIDERIEKL